MDTSETYIKMCEKAEKIQGLWKPTIGDYVGGTWFIDRNDNLGLRFLGIVRRLNPEGKSDCVDCGGDIFWSIENNVWLPRQDQLQEMVTDDPYTNVKNAMWSMLDDLHKFAFNSEWMEFIPVTMEQLWLAFVMKEKYSKVWNGVEWINGR